MHACKIAVAITLALSLTGCAALENNPRAAKGTVIGAAGGAASGAAIGGIVGGGKGAGTGAAIGAVVGALGGGLIGSYMDSQAKEMQGVLDEQDRLNQSQGVIDIAMASDVLFDSGQASIQPGGRDKLVELARVLNSYPKTDVQITGHTDSRGAEESNMDLSKRRADAVAQALAANGVAPGRILVRGEGESRPVATNDTPEGRALNRRVDIRVTPSEELRAEEPR
jgi:outer membrane protein OmpA-like peptidoglycan-associated protein